MGHHGAMRSRKVDSQRLRVLLDERGMSKRDLADMAGLSYSFIKYLVPRTGPAQRNCGATATLIAMALGVDPDDFSTPQRYADVAA